MNLVLAVTETSDKRLAEIDEEKQQYLARLAELYKEEMQIRALKDINNATNGGRENES